MPIHSLTVARVVVERFVSQFGVMRQLHSDCGSNFESKVFSEMCDILGIDTCK